MIGGYRALRNGLYAEIGTSRLEDTADCYARTECWLQAAEAYFEAKCYTKCFSMCLKGKLFSLGFQFLQRLKEECLVENSKSVEFSALRKMYLEKCAQHYFEHGDIENMMPFIKAFSSMDYVRAFLNSRNLVDELLKLEMQVGNFLQAEGIEKGEADVLRATDMLEMTGHFKDTIEYVVCSVVLKSLISFMGWSNKTADKDRLYEKTNEMTNEVGACCFRFDNLGAHALKCAPKSLAILSCAFLVGRKCGKLLIELVASRFLLNVHLQSQASG